MSSEVADEFYSEILCVEMQFDLLVSSLFDDHFVDRTVLNAGVSTDKRVVMTQIDKRMVMTQRE
jgi:hypothetical protein